MLCARVRVALHSNRRLVRQARLSACRAPNLCTSNPLRLTAVHHPTPSPPAAIANTHPPRYRGQPPPIQHQSRWMLLLLPLHHSPKCRRLPLTRSMPPVSTVRWLVPTFSYASQVLRLRTLLYLLRSCFLHLVLPRWFGRGRGVSNGHRCTWCHQDASPKMRIHATRRIAGSSRCIWGLSYSGS